MQTSFFNTIGFEGVKLKDTEEKCSLQEERILSVMDEGVELTPFEVQGMYEDRFAPIPITSIRRGITNLTDAGKLQKTDKMKNEVYGKPNHKWVKLLVILSFALTSCFTPRPSSYQMRISKITPKGDSYRITLKRGYKEFVVYSSNIDTLFVGKLIDVQVMQRIK